MPPLLVPVSLWYPQVYSIFFMGQVRALGATWDEIMNWHGQRLVGIWGRQACRHDSSRGTGGAQITTTYF